MKKIRAPISLLLSLLLLLPLFSGVTATAADPPGHDASVSEYTQKIVAVVYDNSASMNEESTRTPSAQYSLELLISMLDSRDIMKVFPMNNGDEGIPVPLTNDTDRDSVIRSVLSHKAFKRNTGSTPTTSSLKAIQYLAENGMKDKDHQAEADPGKEYWLIILTDGQFKNKKTPDEQADILRNELIGSYTAMNTVYVSFGTAAIDIADHDDLEDLKNAGKFMPYCKVPAADLPGVMQKISNSISSRYPLTKGEQYTVSGNTVTVDLNKIPFSVSGFSVVAQGCGATITKDGGVYAPPVGGSDVGVQIKDICVVGKSIPDMDKIGVKQGCSFMVSPASSLRDGTLTLTFSDTIDDKFMSIYADPAFTLSHYIEVEGPQGWERINDHREIASNRSPGDRIRVGYEVHDPVKDEYLELTDIFGSDDVVADAYYNNAKYGILDPIELVVGTYELSVQVSVMNGEFTLRDTVRITVQENLSDFDVLVSGDTTVTGANPSTTTTFSVLLGGEKASKEELQAKGFAFHVTVTGTDGTVLFERENEKPSADGTITVPLGMETNKFGNYTVTLLTKSSLFLDLEKSHTITYVPDEMTLAPEGSDHITLSQYDLKGNGQDGDSGQCVTFVLTANGQPFPFVNNVASYELWVGDKNVTADAAVTDNVLTFTPTEANLQGLHRDPKDYKITLKIVSDSFPNLNSEANATLTITKTVYTVVPVLGGNTEIRPLDLKNTDAALYFSIERDGTPLTATEMQTSLDSGDFVIDTDPMFSLFFLPAALDTRIETVDGKAVAAIHVVCDMNTYLDWHLSTLITTGDKPITLSYLDSEASQSFTVLPSNAFLWALRFILMIFVIVWLIHLIPFVISLFVAKPLPAGTLVYFAGNGTSFHDINVPSFKTAMLYALWVLVRFLCPFMEFMDQKFWFQKPDFTEYNMFFDRKNGLQFKPEDSETYFRTRKKASQMPLLNRFYNGVRDGQTTELMPFANLDRTSYSLLNYFEKSNNTPLRDDATCQITGGSHYAIFVQNRNTGIVRVSSVITFVAL